NEKGLYRAPLLQLGTYRVIAELQGFKKFEQSGVTLSAGQTAVVNMTLGVGQVTEVVSVTADSPIVNLGKVDQGRTLNEREIKSLPLTSRNPYNFALLQPGVTGFETQEFGLPRSTANGGLIVKAQLFYCAGYENTRRDLSGGRVITITPANEARLGLNDPAYMPALENTKFAIGKVDHQLSPSERLSVRYIFFDNFITN